MMFNQDNIFPNKCELVQIGNNHIYPIFKNGSSSIREYVIRERQDGIFKKIKFNDQIKSVDEINIILRSPTERFISGVNSFVYNVLNQNPKFDINTILYFVENYLFLDRHFSPQILWLVHLSKYANKQAILHFFDMSSVKKFTPWSISPDEKFLLSDEVVERLKQNKHNEVYIKLDNLLFELVDKKLTFGQVLDYIKNKDPYSYTKLSCIVQD